MLDMLKPVQLTIEPTARSTYSDKPFYTIRLRGDITNKGCAMFRVSGSKQKITIAFNKLVKMLELPKDTIDWPMVDQHGMTWSLK